MKAIYGARIPRLFHARYRMTGPGWPINLDLLNTDLASHGLQAVEWPDNSMVKEIIIGKDLDESFTSKHDGRETKLQIQMFLNSLDYTDKIETCAYHF